MERVAVCSLTTNTSMVFLKLQIQECFKTFELYNFMYCHFRTMYYYYTMYIHGLFLTTIFYFIYKVFKHVFRLYTVHSTLHRFPTVLYFNLFIIYLFICYETNKFFVVVCCQGYVDQQLAGPWLIARMRKSTEPINSFQVIFSKYFL